MSRHQPICSQRAITWAYLSAGDDAIALHGSYFSVAVTDAAAKTVIFAAEGSFQFDVGDTLVFYAADTERLGSASVVKMYSVEQPAQTSGKVAGKLQMNEANFMKVRRAYGSAQATAVFHSAPGAMQLCSGA